MHVPVWTSSHPTLTLSSLHVQACVIAAIFEFAGAIGGCSNNHPLLAGPWLPVLHCSSSSPAYWGTLHEHRAARVDHLTRLKGGLNGCAAQ